MDAGTRLSLWAGRHGEQLAGRPRTHPGVEAACRDGSLVHRLGITDGAPEATTRPNRRRASIAAVRVTP